MLYSLYLLVETVLRFYILRTRNAGSHQLLEGSFHMPNVVIIYRYEISLWRGINFNTLHVRLFS